MISILPAIALRVASGLSILLITVVVSEQLPKAEAGVFLIGFSMCALFHVIAQFGLNTYLMREIAMSLNEKGAVPPKRLSQGLRFVMVLSVAITFLLFFGVGGIFENKSSALFVMLAALPFMSLNLFCASMLQGLGHINLYLLFSSTTIPSFSCLLIFAFRVTTDIEAGIVYLSCAVSSALLCWGTLFLKLKSAVYAVSAIPKPAATIKTASRFWFVTICSQVPLWAGTPITGLLLGASEAAEFAMMHRIALAVNFILTAVIAVLSPTFAKLASKKDIILLESILVRATASLTMTAFIIGALYLVYNDTVLSLMGLDYDRAILPLSLMVAGYLFNLMTGPVGVFLLMSGSEGSAAKAAFLGATLVLFLSGPLTLAYGLSGMAGALLLSVIAQNLLSTAYTIRVIRQLKVVALP